MKNNKDSTPVIIFLFILIVLSRCGTCNDNEEKIDSYRFAESLNTPVSLKDTMTTPVTIEKINTGTNSIKKQTKNYRYSSNSNSSVTTSKKKVKKKQNSTKKNNGRVYIRGPRGGCYYINSNGNKTYVDRSLCN